MIAGLYTYAATALIAGILAGTGAWQVQNWRHGEKLEAILTALKGGMSKAAVCRNFNVKRSTLIDTLARLEDRAAE